MGNSREAKLMRENIMTYKDNAITKHITLYNNINIKILLYFKKMVSIKRLPNVSGRLC